MNHWKGNPAPMSQRYQIHQEFVISQVIEGQAILIQPTAGCYYSLNESATWLWECLIGGHTSAEMAACGPHSESTVQAFLLQCLQEKLLLPAQASPAGSCPPCPENANAAPQLDAFRDLGELLALDPPAPGMAEVSWTGV